MYRPHNPHFNRPPMSNRGHPYGPPPGSWRPDQSVSSKDPSKSGQPQAPAVPPPALKPALKSYGSESNRWKPNFGENDQGKNPIREKQSSSERRFHEVYDPYEVNESDTADPPPEGPPDGSRPGRWDTHDSKRRRLSPGPPLFPIKPTETFSSDRSGRGFSSGSAERTDYRTQTSTQLSPPPPLHSYQQSSGYSGPDKSTPPPRAESKKEPGRGELALPKSMVSCDLCEVQVSNGQELEEHLDSKTHWDTLEHIQNNNGYDDMTIAFLQDVMLYKSQKSSRAIEDTALQALQEHDHMTKVEMFHCAACKTFVPTSASSVQNHITSQGHMTNTKEFKVRQRRVCLDKSKTMMKELTPQFLSFTKGGNPFE